MCALVHQYNRVVEAVTIITYNYQNKKIIQFTYTQTHVCHISYADPMMMMMIVDSFLWMVGWLIHWFLVLVYRVRAHWIALSLPLSYSLLLLLLLLCCFHARVKTMVRRLYVYCINIYVCVCMFERYEKLMRLWFYEASRYLRVGPVTRYFITLFCFGFGFFFRYHLCCVVFFVVVVALKTKTNFTRKK